MTHLERKDAANVKNMCIALKDVFLSRSRVIKTDSLEARKVSLTQQFSNALIVMLFLYKQIFEISIVSYMFISYKLF